VPAKRKWFVLLGTVVVAAILFASLAPVGWQMRFGLHWLVEHFLVFFALTVLACLTWPKPMIVAGVLVSFAVLLEAAQGLTPDRTPDLATALSAASGVSLAALLFDLALTLRGKWRNA
jgi:VanZ family protein